MIIDGGVFAQQIAVSGLHISKNGACYFREVFEFFLKVFVFFRFCNKCYISEGMSHFMETYIAIRGLSTDALHKIIPGKINTALIHMAHKWTGVKTVVIIIFQYIDIVEIVQHVFIQSEGELDGYGADQDGHFSTFLYFDIMETTGFSEQKSAEQELTLVFQSQPVIITNVFRNHTMIEGLAFNEFMLLPADI